MPFSIMLDLPDGRLTPFPGKGISMAEHPAVRNLTVEEVKAGMDAGQILLVDVREPDELAAEGIPGAAEMPLSAFDPGALPDPGSKQLVFSCRSGNRSIRASLIAQAAGLPYNAHMAGGIRAWKEAGFKTRQG
jgi:rhodanese-related sulfurtransferase